MNRSRLFAATVAVVLLSACSDNGGTESATSPATSLAASPLDPPPTLGPVTGDLFEPATWIGHTLVQDMMAAPFMHVSLDGVDTGWVTNGAGCGMIEALTLPPACIALVRPDPGGYGHSMSEPATWMVLSWQVSNPQNFPLGGPVFDAVAVTIDDPALAPESQCRSKAGNPGVYEAFIHYDPTYQPAPGATAVTPEDLAAHPVELAWTLDAQHQLVSVPAADVECVLYSYGD